MDRGSISSRLIVGAVLVLAAAAVVDAVRPGTGSEPPPALRETVSIPEIQHPGGSRAIERIGAEWSRRFASNGLVDCYRTSRELCARLHCSQGGVNCTLPTRAYRRSFRAVDVDGVVIVHDEAIAKLSNDEMIRLHADRGTWWVVAVGRDVGRGFFEKPG